MNDYQFRDLSGKHVFITGGGAGIGAYLSQGFLSQGARVSFVQRSDARVFCDQAEAATGQRPLGIVCDLTHIDALHKAMEQAEQAQGGIDVLVNNAGNDQRHSLANLSVAGWDANLAINLRPYFFSSQFVAPRMAQQGAGVIINVSLAELSNRQCGLSSVCCG